MGKYFCPKCFSLTYADRYMTNDKWLKPKHNDQYCRKCDKHFHKKDCIAGLKELKKFKEVN